MISFTVTCLARAIGGNQATVRSYVTVAKIPGSPTVVAGGGTGDIVRLRVGWPSNPKRRRFHCTKSSLCRYKGAVPEEAPFADAAPLPEPPPHPRLLRRLAAFGSPLPAGGERRGERFALRCANDDWRGAAGTRRGFASPRLRGEGSACGRTSGAKRSGGEGAVPEEAPFADAAPLPETPPHPRLLRRLAAFGIPLPAGGERRNAFAPSCARRVLPMR